MFTRYNILKTFIIILSATIICFLVNPANSEDIVKNEVEDINVLVSQVFGGEPNVLMIFGASRSMGLSFGGTQLGKWNEYEQIEICEEAHCGGTGDCDTILERTLASHCTENSANATICGSKHCIDRGLCTTEEMFNNFLACIDEESELSESAVDNVLDYWCGNNDGILDLLGLDICGDEDLLSFTVSYDGGSETFAPEGSDEYAGAAAALEALAGFGQCSSNEECLNDDDPSCNTIVDYEEFTSCMGLSGDNVTIDINKAENCTEGTENCEGLPKYATSKLDAVLTTFFDLLDDETSGGATLDDDVDNPLMCTDSEGLFNGDSTISCEEYMNTPYRNVSGIVKGTGSSSSLPVIGSGNPSKLIDLLDNNDENSFPVRIRPVGFGGVKANPDIEGNTSCTGQDLIDAPFGGFAGNSELSFDNIWKFFRDLTPDGRAILAGAIGHDEDPASNSTFGKDALRMLEKPIEQDKDNRPCAENFAIVITDAQDHCSGDPDYDIRTSEGENNFPPLTGNANRRSAINATNVLRTHFINNPPGGKVAEVMTFVICLGVSDQAGIRMCNAMALAGGTHTAGVIKHNNASGEFGTVNIDFLEDELELLGENDSSPSFAVTDGRLTNCDIGNEDEDGECYFGNSTELFNNAFFNTEGDSLGSSLDSTTVSEDGVEDSDASFAFFVDDPENLREAIDKIFSLINSFPTVGTSPTAPQSSTAVAARDRIFVSLLNPIEEERFWQGRLALYGFVPNPDNFGERIVVRKPSGSEDLTQSSVVQNLNIFTDEGVLNTNATQYHWEAGKKLAENTIIGSKRNLLTVDSVTKDSSGTLKLNAETVVDTTTVSTTYSQIRYEGDTVNFGYCPNGSSSCTGIDEYDLGISFDDVDSMDTVPTYCVPSSGTDTQCLNLADNTVEDCSSLATTPTADCAACIKSCLANRVIDFFSGNTGIATRSDPLGEPSSDACPSTETDQIGCNCPSSTGGSLDNCSVRLGDTFHSTPVVVGSPSALFFDTGFQEFAQKFRNRSAAVYVGANDGFLHSFHAGEFVVATSDSQKKNPFTNQNESVSFFNAGTGKELFAFSTPSFHPDSISNTDATVPPETIDPDYRFGDMKSFILENSSQRSFFDGSPLVADVWIDGYQNGIAENADLCDDAPSEGITIATPDGNIDLCGREWHSVLLTGYRNGGGAYTALDVTNIQCDSVSDTSDCTQINKHMNEGGKGPDYPAHLWTTFDKHFGNTWSDPIIGRVRMKTKKGSDDLITDRWVMFVGGGISPTDVNPFDNVNTATNRGSAFYVIDINSGQIIYKFHPTDPIPTNFPDDDSNKNYMTCDMASEVGAFDINNDGYIDIALAGDSCGRLWEFDVSEPVVDKGNDISKTGLRGDPTTPNSPQILADDWTGHITFCAANSLGDCQTPSGIDDVAGDKREGIFFAPSVTIDDLGRRHVIVVTGNRRNPTDTTQIGKLYNYIDPFVPSFIAAGTAANATTKLRTDITTVIDIVPDANDTKKFVTDGSTTSNNQGEFVVRFASNINDDGDEVEGGEKGFGTPVVVNRVLVFTTFAPASGENSDNPCLADLGLGRVFALDYLTGEPAFSRIPGAQKFLAETSNATDIAGVNAGQGMPTPSQLTFGTRGSIIFSVAFGGAGQDTESASYLILELTPTPSRTQTFFWQEVI